jgi:hypothetical protein
LSDVSCKHVNRLLPIVDAANACRAVGRTPNSRDRTNVNVCRYGAEAAP